MRLEGKIEVGIGVEPLWEFLLDLDRFSSCLPGLDSVEQVDEDTFKGVLTAKLGPMAGSFDFRSIVADRRRPRSMKVETQGKDSVTGSTVRMDIDLTLEPVAADRAVMRYEAFVDVSGSLAIIGDMILRAAASVMIGEFAKRLRQRVERGSTDRLGRP